MSYKAISFRLNMDDLEEAELYQKIMDESESYTSLSSFMRMILKEHFDNIKQEQITVGFKNFVSKQFEHLESRISAGIIVADDVHENRLPAECGSLPEQLSTVLNMFE